MTSGRDGLSDRWAKASPVVYLAGLAAVALLYFVSAKVGLSLAFENESATAVWPPTGIALVAVFLGGYRLLPAVALGAFLANITTQGPLGSVLGITFGNTAEALLGVYLLHRVAFRPTLSRTRDVLALATLAALLSTTVSATVGVTSLWLGDTLAEGTFASVWRTWWLGDAGGDLIVAAALFVLVTRFADALARPTRRQLTELAALVVGLFGLGILIFSTHTQLAYVLFPILFWIALRYRQLGAVVASLVLSGVAIYFTSRGQGPFSGGSPDAELLRAQMFGGVAGLTALLVAAVRTEGERAEELLEASEVAREAVERSERQLAEAQRIAHIGSWEWDIDRDVVTWTDELYRIYGLDQAAFTPTYEDFLERLHPDDRDLVDTTVRRSYETGEPFSFEHRIVRPDGSERVVLGQGVVGLDGGKPVRMHGTAQDITEQKASEEARRKSQERFASLLESAPDAVVIVDEAGRVVLINEQTKQLFRYGEDEVVGQPVELLLPERYRLRHEGYRQGYFLRPQTRPMGAGLELLGRRKDGSEFPVDISLSAIDTEGGRVATAFIRDITERRAAEQAIRKLALELEHRVVERTSQLENAVRELEEAHREAERANAAKSEFLSRMSHELRTPLHSMLGFAQLLQLDGLGPEQAEGVEEILHAGGHLLALIDEVLEIARVEGGELEFEREPVELRDAVSEAVALVRPLAGAAGVELGSVPDLSCRVLAHRRLLVQIVLNLLTNAVKYNREGGSVELTFEPDETVVRLSVTDTGYGIRADQLARLFEPFERIAGAGVAEGSGLGLAVARRLVEAMNGEIEVESTPGVGSTFTVVLPLATPSLAAV